MGYKPTGYRFSLRCDWHVLWQRKIIKLIWKKILDTCFILSNPLVYENSISLYKEQIESKVSSWHVMDMLYGYVPLLLRYKESKILGLTKTRSDLFVRREVLCILGKWSLFKDIVLFFNSFFLVFFLFNWYHEGPLYW